MNNAQTGKLSVVEKVGYSLGDLAANLVFQTFVTFIAYYYTDVFKLEPSTAQWVIGTCGILGGVIFSPIMGIIADRTRTRWGRYRPWILWTSLPFAVMILLTFTTPNISYDAKVIYAFVTYLTLVTLYTANNLPYASLSGVLTGNMAERNSLSAYRFFAVMVAQFIIQVLLRPIVLVLGDGDEAVGFEKIMMIFAVASVICFLVTFFTTRERVIENNMESSSIRDDLMDLLSNKPWVIMLCVVILVFVNLALKSGTYVYYFQYYANQAATASFLNEIGFNNFIAGIQSIWPNFRWPDQVDASAFGLFNGTGILMMVIGIVFSKPLADRFGKRNIYIIFLFLSTLPILGFYTIAPDSLGVMFAYQIFHGLTYGVTIPLLWAMIADVADYSEWKNHRRATAIIFSAMILGLKGGLTVGSTLVVKFLAIYGYEPGVAAQSESAVHGIRMMVSVYASIPFLLSCGLLFFYSINKRMEVQIESDLAARHKPGGGDTTDKNIDYEALKQKAISQPLVENIYTADPSAHVFDGKIYIYPSHDIETGIPFNDLGDHFAMEDYHVLSMESPQSEAVDNGVALHIKDVPWAEQQMWAPDAARKNGKYYLYFPAKRKDGIFQIGVAIGDSPVGPFKPEPEAIKGSYSIDPAVFEDDDGQFYMYFGGIWGGQLQKYRNHVYDIANEEPADDQPALGPIVARMTDDMTQFAETPREISIVDENGEPLRAGDHDRRFFEASWMHKYNGKYYFSYSTGNTHFLCYAMGDNPYGPFTYAGKILTPVIGWTTHHSICEYEGTWYLFYHDSVLSKGVTHLRSVKMAPISYNPDGTIVTLDPYRE